MLQRYLVSLVLLLGAAGLLLMWSRIPPVLDAVSKRLNHISFLVDDNNVLTLGGVNVNRQVNAHTLDEIPDYSWSFLNFTNSTVIPITPPCELMISDAVMVDGQLYIYYTDDLLRAYSIQNQTWKPGVQAHSSLRRNWCRLVKLDSGKLMAVGGVTNDAARICEIYDTASNKWSRTSPLNQARTSEGVIQLKEGSVMIIGGERAEHGAMGIAPVSSKGTLKSCEIFDTLSGKWKITGDLLKEREHGRAIVLDGGDVLIAGGGSDSCERFEPGKGAWRPTGSMNLPRSSPKLIKLKNGSILASGGTVYVDQIVSTCEIYDPQSERWTVTGSMHVPRIGFSETLLPDGKVLAIGGGTDSIATEKSVGSAEIYDPALGTWKPVVAAGQ